MSFEIAPQLKPSRTKVFICSPLSGDFEANRAKAEHYCALAFRAGFMPMTPHAYFPRFLDEFNPAERSLGIEAGIEWLAECKAIWVFMDNRKTPSSGMQLEINEAARLGIPVRYMAVEGDILIEGEHQPLRIVA